MTHVVTESCIKCKFTDCVDVCPVEAIRAEEDVPEDQRQFIALNVELARNWPSITRTKAALPDADDWREVKEKLALLDRG